MWIRAGPGALLTAGLLLAACGASAGDHASIAERGAADARRVWNGGAGRRDDHIGHTLIEPARGFLDPTALVIAAGGGNRWIEVARAPSARPDCVALFDMGRDGTTLEPRLLIEGVERGDRFGFALAFVPGLLDGGAAADAPTLVVGAPRGPLVDLPRNGAGAEERGAVFFFAPGTLAREVRGSVVSAERARFVIRGRRVGERFGAALVGVGDVDGDGRADVCIASAPGHLAEAAAGGRVHLVFGERIEELTLSGVKSVAIDDPRLAAVEVLVGAPGDALGTALIARPARSGRTALLVAGAIESTFVPSDDTWRPSASGAPRHGAGHVVLVELNGSGVIARRSITGATATGAQFGRALAFGDSKMQSLVVGAPLEHDGAGLAVGAVFGFDLDGGSLLWRLAGQQEAARFGWALAIDGATLAVGAPNASSFGTRFEEATREPDGFRRGSVFLLELSSDAHTAPRALAVWHAEATRDHLGFAVAPLRGGADGPGDAFLAGALAWPGAAGTERGRFYLIDAPATR